MEDIVCTSKKLLVIRNNGNPACVFLDTAIKTNWNVIKTNFESSENTISNTNTKISKKIYNERPEIKPDNWTPTTQPPIKHVSPQTPINCPDKSFNSSSNNQNTVNWNIAQTQWTEASYPDSGIGMVCVYEQDMNNDPNSYDILSVEISSDSDSIGIILDVTETDTDSGIFEGKVIFSTSGTSHDNILRITQGDTITIQYHDTTLPSPYTLGDSLDIAATALIGTVVPPLQRAPAPSYFASAPNLMIASAPTSDQLGFAVGGAQDINNFRQSIENNYLPLYTDITYEGLFYDYYFDTGIKQECTKLFCPSYSYAISKDPISGNDDYYLSVGLNSGINADDFHRKILNLGIVLDVSGSMNSPFNIYHYDQFGNSISAEITEDDNKSKISLATESVAGLLDHLTDDDYFGMILFDNNARVFKSMQSMDDTSTSELKRAIKQIGAGGGTNISSGIQKASNLFDSLHNLDPAKYENRIILLTDAMPNMGDIKSGGLYSMMKNNADNGIYTTIIGIGVDFNTELIEKISKVKGANYYSVHSATEFKKRMMDEFEFMVTPLVFDLSLKLDTDGYLIKKVYGSPDADQSTGEIMKVNTLFPSKIEDGQTKGGIILLKLEKTSNDGRILLQTSYEDRNGIRDSDQKVVNFGNDESDFYENSGIQKAVLLTRYAELMKNWAFDERNNMENNKVIQLPESVFEYRNFDTDYTNSQLGMWERQSVPLQVSETYKKIIAEFSNYFKLKMNEIGDNDLKQEYDILVKLGGSEIIIIPQPTPDTTSPVIVTPDDIIIQVTSNSPLPVTFSVSATDDIDGDMIPVCSPTSGSNFSIGVTIVTCNATDTVGNSSSESFTITIIESIPTPDTTSPVVIVPNDIIIQATSNNSSLVSFSVTATDDVDGTLTPTCSHNSGDNFQIGTTIVTCTATDSSENTTSESFTITIIYDEPEPIFDLVIQINQESDDAEEGNYTEDDLDSTHDKLMKLSSSDLDLVNAKYVGLRFNDIQITQGQIIQHAYIQFTSEDENYGNSIVTIYGQDDVNAQTFTDDDGDISVRPLTQESISWVIPDWDDEQTGSAQSTPELKSILQEIIDKQDWSAGNSVAFIFTDGSGKDKNVYTFDEDSSNTAVLHITFSSLELP